MRNLAIFVCLMALGLVLGFAPCPTGHAQASPAISSAQSALPTDSASPATTFTGRISFMGGKYVLASGTGADTFQLDNQERAKEFYGKDVRVTGILDTTTNTIQVADIQATAA